MEMNLEGSNSAETSPPQDGVARLHRPVTGKLAIWCDYYFFAQLSCTHILLLITHFILSIYLGDCFFSFAFAM